MPSSYLHHHSVNLTVNTKSWRQLSSFKKLCYYDAELAYIGSHGSTAFLPQGQTACRIASENGHSNIAAWLDKQEVVESGEENSVNANQWCECRNVVATWMLNMQVHCCTARQLCNSVSSL